MPDTPSALTAALTQGAWSFTGVIGGIDHVRDDYGRPLGERRAPAESRRDVSVELSPCPYHDERHGGMMNRPALEPTMRQFAAVLTEVAALHHALPPGPPSWPRMLAAVLDQFSAPARYLLTERRSDGPVPAALAAGHKLAAGYFGALMMMLREHAAGAPALEPTAEAFAQFVTEHRSLIGASEVCAGPPHHIRVLTRALLCGPDSPAPVAASAERARLARGLAAQIQLGAAWAVCGELAERALLLDGGAPRGLPCRTAFLADRLASRLAELAARPPPLPHHLPAMVSAATDDEPLGRALADLGLPLATEEERACLRAVLDHGDSAITLPTSARPAIADLLAELLARYRTLIAAQWRVERTLREALGFAPETGFCLTPLLTPHSRALEWLEVLTGHHLEVVPGRRASMALRNHRRRIELFA